MELDIKYLVRNDLKIVIINIYIYQRFIIRKNCPYSGVSQMCDFHLICVI